MLPSTHVKICHNVTHNVTKYKLPGGFYQATRSIFDHLEDVGITTIPEQRFFPWFATYDFEALLERVEDDEGSAKLMWERKHQPIVVSVASNVEGFTEPVCFVEENVDALRSSMKDHDDPTEDYLPKVSLTGDGKVVPSEGTAPTPPGTMEARGHRGGRMRCRGQCRCGNRQRRASHSRLPTTHGKTQRLQTDAPTFGRR